VTSHSLDLHIELAYVGGIEQQDLSNQQIVLPLQIPQGSSVGDAIMISGILNLCSELGTLQDLKERVGIFGEIVALEHGLQEGDRIEIYRMLSNDPKIIRREKANKAAKAARIAFDQKKTTKRAKKGRLSSFDN
jgi:putative ubiquitin-RnfH superfamily antitoxin RatB of RatAB toxin-antitoxin module